LAVCNGKNFLWPSCCILAYHFLVFVGLDPGKSLNPDSNIKRSHGREFQGISGAPVKNCQQSPHKQWGTMARLPRLIGRNRALEVLLSSEDIRADQAEAYGYVNRAIADADLDAFVEALATRISKFDKWAIANTKRLVNTSLPPDVELGAGWDACIASLGRSAAQDGIKALMARGFHKPGDVENRLGYYLSQIPR
jgi:hypothetical protein